MLGHHLSSDVASHTQHECEDQTPTLDQKGEFVALGSTSYVELLPSGDIIKRPWPGTDRAAARRRELAKEAEIYDRLGGHSFLVKKKAWDSDNHTLILERMHNGTLKDYLESHKEVSIQQRNRWVTEAAQCIQLLHHSKVIHCDIGPHNFLLDDRLGLKVIDFSGSSIDGSRTEICPGVRYMAPNLYQSSQQNPTVKMELFSLGSTIYYIITGKAPFEDFRSEEVIKKYSAQDFPDLTGICHAEIIKRCWFQDFEKVDDLVCSLKIAGSGRPYHSELHPAGA